MSCEEQKPNLVAHLYGELEGAEARSLRDHLKVCADCREELARLQGVSATLSRWRELEEMPVAAAPAKARGTGLGEWLRRWWNTPAPVPRWAFAGAMAVVVLVGVGARNVQVAREGSSVRVSWGAAPAGSAGEATAALLARSAGGAAGGEGLLTQVAAMMDQSDQRQAQVVARLMEQYLVAAERERQDDLRRFGSQMGTYSDGTELELARTNRQLQLLADLLLAQSGYGQGALRGQLPTRESRLEPGTGTIPPAGEAGGPAPERP